MKQILFTITCLLALLGCQSKSTITFTKNVYTPSMPKDSTSWVRIIRKVRSFTYEILGRGQKTWRCPTSYPETGSKPRKILTELSSCGSETNRVHVIILYRHVGCHKPSGTSGGSFRHSFLSQTRISTSIKRRLKIWGQKLTTSYSWD